MVSAAWRMAIRMAAKCLRMSPGLRTSTSGSNPCGMIAWPVSTASQLGSWKSSLPVVICRKRQIAFLCSDEASYISGTTLTPDGGFTLTI